MTWSHTLSLLVVYLYYTRFKSSILLLVFCLFLLFFFKYFFSVLYSFFSIFWDTKDTDARTLDIVTWVSGSFRLFNIFLLCRLDNFYWSICKFNSSFTIFILLLNPSVKVFVSFNLFLFLKCLKLHFYSLCFFADKFYLPIHFKNIHPYFTKHG